MADKNESGGSFTLGFILGGIIGGLVAMLVAPKTGSETRSDLAERSQTWRTRADEMAASMMDRFDKTYQRNLRSLRDLRRWAPSMVIQGTQVNIAQHQIIRQDGAAASPGETESLSPTPTEAKDYLGPEMDDAQLGRAVSNR